MIRSRAIFAVVTLACASGCSTLPSGGDAGGGCPAGTVQTGSGCALKRPPGQSCTAATECASGYCTDGVCCEVACGGPCVKCNASGKCEAEPELTPEPVCGAYVCGVGACETQCAQDAQCQGDSHCEQHQCVAARGQGSFCTADNQCKSHHCADGFCCDAACNQSCEACNLAGNLGRCSPIAAGSTGNPSCGSYLCDGLFASCPLICSGDDRCVAGRYCDAQGACAAKKAVGTVCADARECTSNFCADGYCCNQACLGGCDACNVLGNEGTCRLSASGSAGSPSCSPLLCNGTAGTCPPTCASDFECISGRFCGAGACQLQKADGLACTEGRECQSGHCADGVCCNQACSAQCDSCNQVGTVGQCTLAAAGASGSPACAPYACNGATANCGLACTTVGPGAPCGSGEWCDGTACAQKGPNGAVCSQTYQCQSGQCADGFCCNSACAGACDSCNQRSKEGLCSPVLAGTVVLVCGNFVCDGATTSCPAACGSDNHCIASAWCDGAQCVSKRAQGQACTRDGTCSSGHCADGFCCDAVCGNGCDRCDISGLVGTCSVAPYGATPAPACSLLVCNGLFAGCPANCTSDADCVQSAWCNAGVCTNQRPTGFQCTRDQMCTLGHCSDGYCCDQACSGACDSCSAQPGTCLLSGAGSLGTPSCNGFVCDGSSATCPVVCATAADCAPDFYCTGPGGSCLAKQPDGALCGTNANACVSGFCADGRCCNTACNGGCQACDVNPGTCTSASSGTSGTPSCAPYVCDGVSGDCPNSCPSGPDLGRGCVPGYFCEANVCSPKKPAGGGCFSPTQCQTGFCVDGVCCLTACSGACDVCNLAPGTCTPSPVGVPGSPTCFPFTCDGTTASCPTSCAGNGDCATNNCSGGVCQKRALGDACLASFECGSACCDRTSLLCTAGPSNCL